MLVVHECYRLGPLIADGMHSAVAGPLGVVGPCDPLASRRRGNGKERKSEEKSFHV
jgi:hypothetical protein